MASGVLAKDTINGPTPETMARKNVLINFVGSLTSIEREDWKNVAPFSNRYCDFSCRAAAISSA
jgi:hypothetical protein